MSLLSGRDSHPIEKRKNQVIAKDKTFMYFVMKFTQQFVKIQFYHGKSINKI